MTDGIIIAGPGGNYTAFVFDNAVSSQQMRKKIDNDLRRKYPIVEQTCFVSKENDIWRGEMAGGEFCGAAALGLAFLISKQEKSDEAFFSFSGCNDFLSAKIRDSQVTAEFFKLSKGVVQKLRENLYVVELPGITHFVTFDNVPLPQPKLRQLIMQYQIQDRAAVGLMIVKSEAKNPTIDPWVWVRDIDSLINETACISGAVATASVISDMTKSVTIQQPCGAMTEINFIETSRDIAVSVASPMNILHLEIAAAA
ncbi:MAG TPA: hypothetical protein PKW15_02230 [Alphaproteobacteria bacterium]|nr:hypothetical protein [Rhodospirillaceae bacterium]HRJ12042.1 hypothetical protein [Alphaproteobacteria bacterium]